MSDFFTIEMSDPRFEFEGLRQLTVKSHALGRRADVTVFDPKAGTDALPLVILLHGVYGSHWAWTMKGGDSSIDLEYRMECRLQAGFKLPASNLIMSEKPA